VSRKRFRKRLPVVEVIWADCLLFTGGWERHDDTMRQVRDIEQRSVGYVLRDDKHGLVLTAALSQGGNVFGTQVIPAAQIISRRTLK
jgi:hypothetical protein